MCHCCRWMCFEAMNCCSQEKSRRRAIPVRAHYRKYGFMFQENGFFTSALFNTWMEEALIPFICECQRVLKYMGKVVVILDSFTGHTNDCASTKASFHSFHRTLWTKLIPKIREYSNPKIPLLIFHYSRRTLPEDIAACEDYQKLDLSLNASKHNLGAPLCQNSTRIKSSAKS